MKIGILTHPLETNYGGLLQAYALQTVIRRMGHEVYTIDRHNKEKRSILPRHLVGLLKRYYKRYIQHDTTVSTCWNAFLTIEQKNVLGKNMWPFVQRNIRITDRVWSHELRQIDEKYLFDAYVVGSDQVWLPNYCPDSFLNFVKRDGIIKCSYAASCSASSWTADLINKCKPLAQSFKGLSVREQDLVDFCQRELECSAQHVLDPTLLLDKEDFLAAVNPSENNSAVIFSYILDKTPEKELIVKKTTTHFGLSAAWVNAKKPYYKRNDIDINECIFPSVDEWINNLNNATFVVTDSFHGMAMSIVFKKPFVVIGNKERGISRFKSLLELLGLEDRLISSTKEFTEKMLSPIDYSRVYNIIDIKRKESLDFLQRMLDK